MTIIDVDKITVMKAIKSLAPNAKCIVNENNSKDIIWSEGTTPIASGEIDAEIIRLQAEYDAQEYARDRVSSYPSVGDQLDMMMKDKRDGTTTHQTACEAVKAKYPKP